MRPLSYYMRPPTVRNFRMTRLGASRGWAHRAAGRKKVGTPEKAQFSTTYKLR